MKLYFIFVAVLYSTCFVSGYDIFEGFLKLSEGCFDLVKAPRGCNRTLAQSFRTRNRPHGVNEPTTLVYLFTPDNPDKAESLHQCGGRLPSGSTYDPDAQTEIFIHGWLDGICRTAWMREMKEQLVQRGRYNVILVDWTWGNFDYLLSSFNCRVVGEQVGFIINNIMRQTGCSAEKFHVIGHSFGAIAAGFTGRSVKGLRRITGLDPAYAPLGNAPPNLRLTYRDARIVDIIHSNSYQCFALGTGDSRFLGHADFYPNGGQFQASCYPYIVESFLKLDFLYAIGSLEYRLGSHLQSIQFYKISINPKGCEFVGVASSSYETFKNRTCRIADGDWAVMGMNYELYHNSKRRRKFYLTTLNTCPYYDNSYLKGKKFPFSTNCTS